MTTDLFPDLAIAIALPTLVDKSEEFGMKNVIKTASSLLQLRKHDITIGCSQNFEQSHLQQGCAKDASRFIMVG